MAAKHQYRSRKQREQRQNWWGYIILGISLLAVVTFFVFFTISSSHHKALDETTLCPTDGPESITVVIIDRSESLTPVQQELLRKHLMEVKESVPRFGSLEVYTVGYAEKALLKPEIKLCNPGRGQDVSEWTANPNRVEKKWRTQFSETLDDIFSRLVIVTSEQSSPIMETIQSIAATSLTGPRQSNLPVKLVIVSDFIQHTSQYSQYKGVEPFDKFKATSYFRQVQTDLKSAEIEMFYLLRETRQKVQNPEHVQFWRYYFAANNGTVVHYLPI